jgi:hypothetical protein
VLVWTQTRGLLNVMQLVFGLTYTNLSVYLRFGVHLFVKLFRDNLLARVSIPSMEEIESFKEAFAARHPLTTNCWVTMDSLKLFINSPEMQSSKNATTMVGCTSTTSRPFFAFVQMGQFQLLSLTYQCQFTTVRLWSMGIFMESWKMFSVQQVQSVASTWPLDR